METSQPGGNGITLGGGYATGGSVTINTVDPVALLESLKPLLSSSKHEPDLISLVRETLDLRELYKETDRQLQEARKDAETLREIVKDVEEKDRLLVDLQERANKIIDGEQERREREGDFVKKLIDANTGMSESNGVMYTKYNEIGNQLSSLRETETQMSEKHKIEIRLLQASNLRLENRIRDLEGVLATNLRLDLASDPSASESFEEVKRLEKEWEDLKQDEAKVKKDTEDFEENVRKKEDELRKESLKDAERELWQGLLGIAKADLETHQKEVVEVVTEKLQRCEENLHKEKQRHNSVGTSSSGRNSQWSLETGTSIGTTLTKCTSCGSVRSDMSLKKLSSVADTGT